MVRKKLLQHLRPFSYTHLNKTNGITQRRFLLHANPLLADWITAHIGPDWITDLPQLKKLAVYADDELSLIHIFIEIGAVKVNSKKEITDHFHRLIKPQVYKWIHDSIHEVIHVPQPLQA